MQEAVLSVGEGGFSFEQIMEIHGYLPEGSEIRAGVFRRALKMATSFEQALTLYENRPDGAEIEVGILNMLIDTANTFEQLEEVYLHCSLCGYGEGASEALSRMLRRANTRGEVENVYVHAPNDSEIEAMALKKMDSM